MLKRSAFILLSMAATASAFDIVKDGKPNAVVVISASRMRVMGLIQPAAQEFVLHVKLISGAELPMVDEKEARRRSEEGRIYIGESSYTKRKLGINARHLPREGFRIVADENAKVLAIVGNDRGSHPARKYDNPSTYYGVAHFLEKHLGVRWIMPGDVGIYYEPRSTIAIESIEETKVPPYVMRFIRNVDRFIRKDVEEGRLHGLEIDPKEFLERYRTILQWQRRMRLGAVERMAASHNMMSFYDRFYPEHPEYFAMQFDGTRRLPSARTFKLCVSNPEVVAAVTAQARKELAAGRTVANLGFNDGDGWCFCPRCKSLDPRNPRHTRKYPTGLIDGPKSLEYAWLTDRYLTLWNSVASALEEKYPHALFGVLKYGATSDAPQRERYHPKLFMAAVTLSNARGPFGGEWVPRGMDDMFDAGLRSFYWRPNLMWNYHYGMPYVPVRKFARAVHYFTLLGMKGFDHDSWNNHFGTSGALMYAACRLAWSPWLEGDYLMREYAHKGFGGAGDAVYRYLRVCEDAAYVEGADGIHRKNFFDRAMMMFTPERLSELDRLTDEVRTAGKGDAEQFRKRTEIFLKGHEFTMLQGRVLQAISAPREPLEAYYEGIYQTVKAREDFLNNLGLDWALNAASLRNENVNGGRAEITRYDVYWKTKNANLPEGVPACMALAGAGRPVVSAIKRTVKVDGKDDDWRGAPFSERFKDYRSLLPGEVLTKAAFAYDDEALNLCVVTDEPQVLIKQKAERDSATIFANDGIEIFIDPERDGESYFHLVADFLGQQYDGSGALLKKTYSAAWDGQWDVAVAQKGKQTWVFEFRVPFAQLGRRAPKSGERWRVNANRTRKEARQGRVKKEKNYLSLSPTMGSFHDIDMGAGLVFGKPKAAVNLLGEKVVGHWKTLSVPVPETPTRMYRLRLRGNWIAPLDSRVKAAGRLISVRQFAPAAGEKTADHYFLVPEEVEKAELELTCESEFDLSEASLVEYESLSGK